MAEKLMSDSGESEEFEGFVISPEQRARYEEIIRKRTAAEAFGAEEEESSDDEEDEDDNDDDDDDDDDEDEDEDEDGNVDVVVDVKFIAHCKLLEDFKFYSRVGVA